jgi:predicted short-subunit dehydrogenase-like oxidoreductase (DUF2520 family)
MSNGPRILLVGTGRMAYQLGHAVVQAGMDLVGVAGRSLEARNALARYLDRRSIDLARPLPGTDLVLLAVSDDAIAEVAHGLPDSGAVVAHTAGALGMDLLAPHADRGVLWPIQSLGHGAAMDLREVPLVVDASSDRARRMLLEVAGRVSEVVLELAVEQRQRVHLAAVLTSNLPVWLASEGQRLLRQMKLPTSLLTPLWKTTAAKLAAHGPDAALTGPARRGDRHTVQHHLALLADEPELQRIYALLSEQIMRAYGHNG